MKNMTYCLLTSNNVDLLIVQNAESTYLTACKNHLQMARSTNNERGSLFDTANCGMLGLSYFENRTIVNMV